MENLVAKRYAKALMGIEGISLEDVNEQLGALAEAIESSSELKEFLESPLISSSKKFDAIIAPLKEKLDPKVFTLLELMAQKNRLALIPELKEILTKEIRVASNHFVGTVESADKIEQELIDKLAKKLEMYSGADIDLEVKESDIDGVKVEVSDLGLELHFSKESAKKALIEHIQKAL